jgi:hypothetical protein
MTLSGMQRNEDGTFSFFDVAGMPAQVDDGYSRIVYPRPKGPKMTVQIPASGGSIGSIKAAIAAFTRIAGVDTNSRVIDGVKVSVTVVCELLEVSYRGDVWSGCVEPLWALEFRDPTRDPERIGWSHAFSKGVELGWFDAGERVLMVVDSHLGELENINRRTTSIIDEVYLPVGASIAYASPETTDSPVNGLIRHCDRLSSGLLDHVEENLPTGGPSMKEARTPFGSFRYWLL